MHSFYQQLLISVRDAAPTTGGVRLYILQEEFTP